MSLTPLVAALTDAQKMYTTVVESLEKLTSPSAGQKVVLENAQRGLLQTEYQIRDFLRTDLNKLAEARELTKKLEVETRPFQRNQLERQRDGLVAEAGAFFASSEDGKSQLVESAAKIGRKGGLPRIADLFIAISCVLLNSPSSSAATQGPPAYVVYTCLPIYVAEKIVQKCNSDFGELSDRNLKELNAWKLYVSEKAGRSKRECLDDLMVSAPEKTEDEIVGLYEMLLSNWANDAFDSKTPDERRASCKNLPAIFHEMEVEMDRIINYRIKRKGN